MNSETTRTEMKPAGTEPHYVLPLEVYEKYYNLIQAITNGEFNPHELYNIVFLYTDQENATRAGTVLYGTDGKEPLIKFCSRMMEEIASEQSLEKKREMFRGFHSYLREGLWFKKPAGATDPCATKNPLPPMPKKQKTKKKRFGLF